MDARSIQPVVCAPPSARSPLAAIAALTLASILVLTCTPVRAAGQAATSTSAAPSGPASAADCPAILQHTFQRLQDEKPQPLCQYKGRVLLVVNTASFCGFTPQYKGLEALHSKYRDRGLVVLGFPSNDFAQESGSNKEIADFCESTFGVKFPMFVKSSVRGPDANPLFKELSRTSGTTPKWNFYKYLVARDGHVVDSYSSMTSPDDRAFVRELERQLAKPVPGSDTAIR